MIDGGGEFTPFHRNRHSAALQVGHRVGGVAWQWLSGEWEATTSWGILASSVRVAMTITCPAGEVAGTNQPSRLQKGRLVERLLIAMSPLNSASAMCYVP